MTSRISWRSIRRFSLCRRSGHNRPRVRSSSEARLMKSVDPKILTHPRECGPLPAIMLAVAGRNTRHHQRTLDIGAVKGKGAEHRDQDFNACFVVRRIEKIEQAVSEGDIDPLIFLVSGNYFRDRK